MCEEELKPELKRRGEYTLTYPNDWEDEDRMHFLLSPFPPTALSHLSLNDQKAQFWSSLVRSACRVYRQPLFTEGQMQQMLQWKGQAPCCLHHVLELMQQAGQLRLVKQPEERRTGGWLTWGFSYLSRPIKWLWSNYHSTTIPEQVYYVDTQLLKEMADIVLDQLQSRVEFKITDQLVTGEQFRAVCKELVEASSVPAVETELIQQGKIHSRTFSSGIKVMKFTMADEHGPVRVTDMDQGILSIKKSITTLHCHISSLTNRIHVLKRKAKEQLHLKQRQLALQCVRRVREVQQLVVDKTAMLDNLQHILQQIQMAETNALVMDAYHKGTETLKSLQQGSGLTVNEAERTIDELHAALDIVEEVGDVLGVPVPGESVEDEELEKELQALLSIEKTDNQPCPTQKDDMTRRLAHLQLQTTDPAETREQQSANSKRERLKSLLT